MITLLAVLASGLMAWGLTGRLARPSSRLQLLDVPGERSLHTNPTPRTGGLGVLGGVLVGGTLALLRHEGREPTLLTLLALAAVAAVSLLDDRRGVSPAVRLVVHLGAAIGVVFNWRTALPEPGWLAAAALVLAVVWLVNLYNFMDGMDGFAGGMSLLGFGFLALLARPTEPLLALLCAVIAAAAAGFLWFNFPPARIFLGDAGSAPLGLLCAAAILWGQFSGAVPALLGLVVFSPFVVDASVTLARRLLRGERVWEAHRNHYYQRLVLSGWGHRRTVLAEYGLMLATGASALLVHAYAPGAATWLALGWAVAYAVLGWLIDRWVARHPG